MDIMQALNTRRSIRKFTDEPVSDEALKHILEAAMMAPSAGNGQPWEFIVVTDEAVRKQVSETHPYIKMAAKAPAGVLVCGNLSKEKFPGYWMQDCAAAMENLLLAVHGLGLGAVWTGVYPKEDRVKAFTELFKLPKNIIPFGYAPIGHPAQTVTSESRYTEANVHYNSF